MHRDESWKEDPVSVLARSRALWNRSGLDLDSDEILAQVVDRGSLQDWQALYRLLGQGTPGAARLCERLHALLPRVPTAYPGFWRAALASVGFPVDWEAPASVSRDDAGV